MIIFRLTQLLLKIFHVYDRSMLIHLIILHSIIIGLCIFEVYIIYTRRNYKHLLEENKKYLEMQNQCHATLYQKEKELKSFYHDFNNHIICMKKLSNDGNYHELNKYINAMALVKHKINYGVHSGNPMIDEIINDILSRREDNIDIKFEGILPADLKIELYDLCTIFSNVLINAVEACEKLKCNSEKQIIIKTSIFKNTLNLVVMNPFEGKNPIEHGEIVSTKMNKQYHGFGLSNVRKAVRKYYGDMKVTSENGMFIVNIVIHNINKLQADCKCAAENIEGS